MWLDFSAMEYFILGVLFTPFILAGGILMWACSTMLLDTWRCGHPQSKRADRLLLLQERSLADEAQDWLSSRV
jgi:hypothetical protein